MGKQRIELTAGTVLRIADTEGDVIIRGQQEPLLEIELARPDGAEIEQEEGVVVLRLHRDARLRVWSETPITLEQADGDITVRGVRGALRLNKVVGDVVLSDVGEVQLRDVDGDVVVSRAGDVRAEGYLDDDVHLRQVGQVSLEEVSGDLAVRGAAALSVDHIGDDVAVSTVKGSVRVQEARGDAALRGVEGAVEIGRVRGDLSTRNLQGNLLVTRVDGDISLYVAFLADRQYRLAGRRGIHVRFPETTAARFVIQAPRWSYPKEGFEVETEEEGRAVVRFGQDGPDVHLSTDGEVVLRGTTAADWERNMEEFGRRMEEWGMHFGQQMDQWGQQLRHRLEEVDWERFGQEIDEATSRITRLVETRLQEIDPEQMRRQAERAADRVEEQVHAVDWDRIARKIEQAAQVGLTQAQAGLDRLQERLRRQEEKLAQAEKKAREKTAKRPEEVAVQPPAEPAPPSDLSVTVEITEEEAPPAEMSALDEERLAVLTLVEEGRLTAEEAGALLDALEE